MPKLSKTTSYKMDNVPSQEGASTQEDSCSEQESNPEVTFSPPQSFQCMFMPYR